MKTYNSKKNLKSKIFSIISFRIKKKSFEEILLKKRKSFKCFMRKVGGFFFKIKRNFGKKVLI